MSLQVSNCCVEGIVSVQYVTHNILTGNNLFLSLLESKMDIRMTELYKMHQQGRVKGYNIENSIQLLALAELLKCSSQGEKVYLILEGLSGVFLALKVKHPPCYWYIM